MTLRPFCVPTFGRPHAVDDDERRRFAAPTVRDYGVWRTLFASRPNCMEKLSAITINDAVMMVNVK